LYDDLVSPEILALIPPAAQLHNVGKRSGKKRIQQEEINFLMIGLAESGMGVIRLKSGDPLIFGRGGEEIEALRGAAIPYEIVPGVTSALGAAAIAAIPLTHRQASSALVLLTAHQAPGSEAANWNKLAGSGATLVIYMPGQDYGAISAKLSSAGLSIDTPCALVSQATTPQQRIYRTTVEGLMVAPHLATPTLLVVGEVVRFADEAKIEEFAASTSRAELSEPGTLFPAVISLSASITDEEPLA
jgi:uroporphyrin-III C-methyltransferase